MTSYWFLLYNIRGEIFGAKSLSAYQRKDEPTKKAFFRARLR